MSETNQGIIKLFKNSTPIFDNRRELLWYKGAFALLNANFDDSTDEILINRSVTNTDYANALVSST